jgi:hypothetical protein
MDATLLSSVAELSNHALLTQVRRLAERERGATAALIAHLAELDARRLYLAGGCSSLFTYCTQVLHLSEHAAYGRIEAARAVRRFPIVLEKFADGSVNLTTAGLLAAHLTPENPRDLLDVARHKSKRQVEELVARLRPRLPVPSSVRRLPTASHTTARPAAPADAAASAQPTGSGQGVRPVALPAMAITPPPARPAVIAPLAPERYKVQFTAGAETYAKLRLAQDLLRHQIPDGDLGKVFDRALTALVQDLTKKKFAATDRPRGSGGTAPGSRHVSVEVKRAVWLRDGGRCAFVSRDGRRCVERGFLEFHHVTPYAAGGVSTADNIQLRCRAHNGYEAERYFAPRGPSIVREPGGSYAVPSRAAAPGGCGPVTRSRPSYGLGRPAASSFSGRVAQQRAGAAGAGASRGRRR